MKKTKLILATAMLALLFSGCGGMGPGGDNNQNQVTERIPTQEELTTDAPDPTDTNLETAFNEILTNPDWGKVNTAAIKLNKDGTYSFDARHQTACIKRKIVLTETKRLTFKIKPYIYEPYDGVFQFLIDDKIVATYTGEHLGWSFEQFELEAGTHTIEWRRYDIIAEWTIFGKDSKITPHVDLGSFEFTEPLTALTSISQNFEDALSSEMWTGSGLSAGIVEKDPIYAAWPQYGDALVDTHEKVYHLACAIGEGKNIITGDSSLTIQKIKVTEESALSFDYKCDLLNWTDNTGIYHKNYLRVFIDNNQTPCFEGFGTKQMWQKASIILPTGTHSVKFVCGTDDNWYGNNMTNSTFLDNITLASNTIASVDIYPKGLQETYVNGDSIQFSAKALRSDGSVITGKDVTWSANGGSIDSNGKFTPGTSAGTFTVTATIDGLTASNQNVKVHGANYLTDSVTINGHTFTGEITNKSGNLVTGTKNITLSAPTPDYNEFTTNGFFVIKGSATNTKGISVLVRKQGPGALTVDNKYNPDYKYQTVYYIPAGAFEQRVWLRFGDGDYDVYIEEVTKTNSCEDYDGYEGAVLGWWTSGEEGTWLYYNVTNKTDLNLSAEDYAALTPSAWCQCDDFLVSNPFNAIMAELPPNATIGQKLQALYDWEIHNFHYDYVSFTDNQSTTKRKKQDAVHAVKYGMAVCEGYADLYTAFARLAGLKSIYQTSEDFNHAWTEVYYNGAWKMIDATWDDPSEVNSTNKFPTSEYYSYFLIDPDDASHIKEGKNKSDRKPDISRTISTSQTKYPSSVN